MIRGAAILGVLAPMHLARAAAPAMFYLGHALLCTVPATGAGCTLWLDPDGRYTVFFDSGAAGVARYAARHGAYQVSAATDGAALCLRPDPDPPPPATTALFAAPGCVTLPMRPIGEVFTLAFGGQNYRLVLVQGR